MLRHRSYIKGHQGQRVHFDLPKGALDIYENTGPGNGEKFTVAPLILPYKTVHGPVSAWSKILHVIPINFDLVHYWKALLESPFEKGTERCQFLLAAFRTLFERAFQ